jgi:uncharacterized protein YecE (DUF72 family)
VLDLKIALAWVDLRSDLQIQKKHTSFTLISGVAEDSEIRSENAIGEGEFLNRHTRRCRPAAAPAANLRAGKTPAPRRPFACFRRFMASLDLGAHMTDELRIGISGWTYAHWRHDFYAGVPQRAWLQHAAHKFDALEINGSFYRLQSQAALARWHEETPPGLIFTAKGHRFLTHAKKLLEPAEPIARCRANMQPLRDKLKVVLWQLPRQLACNLERLAGFGAALGAWPEVRHAIEFRHISWFTDEVAACLTHHAIANCLSDAASWPIWERTTTDLVYVRLHGHEETYRSPYSRAALMGWAKKIRAWLAEGRAVHVYFDNDGYGAAPKDALALKALLGAAPAARTPQSAGKLEPSPSRRRSGLR